MAKYKRNHYVPQWYQNRFIPDETEEKKFYYLDLKPQTLKSGNKTYARNNLLRWGPKLCFCEDDLYTTKFGNWESTEIEEKFFGRLDSSARAAAEYFSTFEHPSVDGDAFLTLLRHMSIQKLRTPKGLAFLGDLVRLSNKNHVLIKMQELQNLFCAFWTESIWSIADASDSPTKFIISDHPVTVYNRDCLPTSRWCQDFKDPNTAFSGTHTIFPLNLEKVLILTNLSWVRNPYSSARSARPNPVPFRDAVFNFMTIQTGRKLSEREVNEINLVIKKRAYRYVAAAKKEWLFPENSLPDQNWANLGSGFLFMPDPRSVSFSTNITIGYTSGHAESYDPYGRKPWEAGYRNEKRQEKEQETFLAHQGQFARLFGPKRRGRSFECGRLDNEEDDEDYHNYHLSLEEKYKPKVRL